MDPYTHMGIILNPNGTVTRTLHFPSTPPSSDDPTLPALTKDLTINPQNNTWLRLFLPTNPNPNPKLPLIIFFHGSGFVICSAASTMFHDFCLATSTALPAVIASVEYRLAPEHRLPAAYEDAVEALTFIRNSDDEWLTKHADIGNCYLMGNSAGGTIAYFAGLRAAERALDLEPLKIRGLILRQPFFGGTHRTESEMRLEFHDFLPLCVSDLLWDLALPVGADRDHEYANLRAENWAGKLGRVRELGWRVLVSANHGDPLVDRCKELVGLLEENGVQVATDFDEEGGHGVEFQDAGKASKLIDLLKRFVLFRFNVESPMQKILTIKLIQ